MQLSRWNFQNEGVLVKKQRHCPQILYWHWGPAQWREGKLHLLLGIYKSAGSIILSSDPSLTITGWCSWSWTTSSNDITRSRCWTRQLIATRTGEALGWVHYHCTCGTALVAHWRGRVKHILHASLFICVYCIARNFSVEKNKCVTEFSWSGVSHKNTTVVN